ncbi:Na+/H+ antiporter NhaC family protein [Gemmatimonadota bacterium]
MTSQTKTIAFRGGPFFSVIPIAVFLLITVFVLLFKGIVQVETMILAAMAGISLGLLFSRNVAEYSEQVFSLMANRIATVALVCWLWAGAFSGILAHSGLIEAIVWIGWKMNLSGGVLVLTVFVCSALFAVSVGTAFGTIVGFTTVIYPAGILLGADPAALMGAILSGAAFGDNLAPVSDTTIVSAATQETDIGGVVISRLKYSLTAGIITGILFFFFGGGESVIDPAEAGKLLAETATPEALPMLIPALIVIVVALCGYHFLVALNLGILSALVIGPLTGILPLEKVVYFTPEGSIGGSVVSGITAMLPISILVLLIITANGLMEAGGFYDRLLSWLDRVVAGSVRRAESAIIILISFACLCLPGNTSAMVTVGPLANKIRKQHEIHPYRSANLLDTIACSFPYMLPYAAVIIIARTIQNELVAKYNFVVVVSWWETAPFVFYGIVLFPLMIISVITGFGRKKG